MKTPNSIVKDKFGDKAKLVAAVEKFGDDLWLARTNKEKGLGHVSNSKLLKLHATFTTVKEKFGTRAKLIDAIIEIEKRAKDEGYKTHIGGFPVPRLYDMYRSLEKKKAGAAEKKAPSTKKSVAAPKKDAAEKKAPKKAAAAKKA
ncbi:hypothetical protein BH09MYX1_BH09MYX1_32430 [soil metagenome]